MSKSDNQYDGSFGKWAIRNLVGIVLVFLGVAIVASFILRVRTHHGKEIEVPDLTNMTVAEAKYEASHDGLKVEVYDSVYVKRLGRGQVFSQNPKAGSKVKKGRRILLTINSVTPKKVQMPNLVGYSMRQAKAELLSRGLALGKLIYVNDIATNNVLRQLYGNRQIKAGSMIDSGSEIDLVVGLNSEENQTFVPNVNGMKYLRAVDAIHDSQLNVKKSIFDKSIRTYADSLDAIVYKQSPGASSAPILMGSDVTIYLKKDVAKEETEE